MTWQLALAVHGSIVAVWMIARLLRSPRWPGLSVLLGAAVFVALLVAPVVWLLWWGLNSQVGS